MKVRLRDRFFPEGGKTRTVLRKWNTVAHILLFKIKRIIRKFRPSNIKTVFFSLKNNGWKYTVNLVRKRVNNETAYSVWMSINDPTPEELKKQRKTKFELNPKISIIVPMYNTPVDFFEEMVDSLKRQTYSKWELCLADGSPKKNDKLEKICKTDKRIKYNFLGKNLGISGNTNAALKIAGGDYIALLDHDDFLPPNALFEIVRTINEHPETEFIYSDEDKFNSVDRRRIEPHFKPDFAIDTLRSNNYICHFSVFRKDLMDKLGGFRSEYDGAQDYDIIIRMAEVAKHIRHIPKILYHWRVHGQSTAMAGEAKPYAFEAGIKVLESHLERIGLKGKVTHGATLGTYKIDYEVYGSPKVTVLIPNMNEPETLRTCVNSVLKLTTYQNYEIVIIENNSTTDEIFRLYTELENNPKIKILYYPEKGFNYSRIINFGVKNTDGEYIVQLNNDTEILTPDWLEKMLGMNQREDVGAVGAKLYYPDGTIQHAGTIVGIYSVAGHVFRGLPNYTHGYFARDSHIQNLSAVTAACMMAKRSLYEEVGYMDEDFAVAFNDIDFCLKIINNGKLIIYNPFVELIHYESKSRGDDNTPEKKARFQGEIDLFLKKWKDYVQKGDPYYNINLRLDSDQYDIKQEKVNI